MGKEDFIRIDNVTKRFGKQIVLNNLSLSIPFTGIFGIMGLSGCGKTTLLNVIIGFWRPDSGAVYYNGINIREHQRVMNQLFGFATQAGSVYPKLTVEENLEYFGRLYNMQQQDIKKRIEELLKLVELEDSRHVLAEELSTGMYRRLDIACSMIHNPKILILDEPTGNLDPVLRKKLMALIKRIDDNGTKVIITSHLLGEIEKICDTLAIIHHGKILEMGSPDELKDKYTKDQVIKIETKKKTYENLIPYLKRAGAKNIFQKERYMYIYTRDPEKILITILSYVKSKGDELLNVEVSKPSIEEVFEAATRK
ncbi:MAG: antibiotic transport system ATP-binding protein [archaeon GW2011_AR17]|nr:MAG: antibiotic transport system ATP-binding protein [archaeon GW2011_AR17]MBS3154457.1 ABC transporter ATP-binding protein [Candidatus Woesearchaeota archaeon]HIH15702.1 ABC transporter ATP-binding protein [Nanoarchaeota archaeon]HIH59357.1 ABC transporter ATP-binding protein [Nanoarchaeota archaeon]HII13565.1 ABC transporter ATP-binding protein [Nanoarchaeota archaeon]